MNPFVFYIVPNPTNVLLNGNAVANAASALQSDTNAGSRWIVDSGVTRAPKSYLRVEMLVVW